MTANRWRIAGLVLVLAVTAWWRGHTIAGTIRDQIGFAPYPVVAEAEPLDCDECIYGYIGKRIASGDVMYRDLTENKPPLGYWIYAATVAIGGANETAIRVMPVPMVLATIVLIWWVAGQAAGPIAAIFAAFVYPLMSTDPFVYGNGANMEHALNLFATAALACVVRWREDPTTRWLVASGACVMLAAMVKQVAIVPIVVFIAAIVVQRATIRSRSVRIAAILAGAATVTAVVVAILVMQGAGGAAIDDIFRYGGALARDTPSDPKEWPFAIRALVGNTDPEGRLPWPFGKTLGRAWWAAGAWPIWLASLPCTIAMAASKRPHRRLIAAWLAACWVGVAMPRLFWQHYYLLAVPGVSLVVAIVIGDAVGALQSRRSVARSGLVAAGMLAAVAWTTVIQVREYLMVAPNLITERDKGGRQWVVLRDFGRELGRRTQSWDRPTLWVWGIQSPMYFYSGMDSVTRQVFADPLTTAFAQAGHPQVAPRLARTMRDLEADPPDIIFVGERPFPALVAFLNARYVRSPLARQGLWIRRDRVNAFASQDSTK